MKRRTLLRAAAVGGAGSLAACVDAPGDSADGPTGTETETETESPESNAMTSSSFEVLDVGCGGDADVATVERGEDRVAVDGIIQGQNGCYTADLERADYDDGTDELTVDVRSYDDGDGGGCTECIVDIDYSATFEFSDGTPEEVHVRHNGDHVTTG